MLEIIHNPQEMEHDVTQRISIIILNNLQEGDITIKNTAIIRYFKVATDHRLNMY